jgi:hypothetical protein
MTGSPQEIIDKILAEREILGIDRFIGQVDLGGLPPISSTGPSSCWPPRSPRSSAKRPAAPWTAA